jgi:hypothetical protein
MLVLTSTAQRATTGPSWGHGGWLMPHEREALDWATLGRLCGWDVEVVTGPPVAPARWLIIACDPDKVDRATTQAIARRLERQPLLVVTRAPAAGTVLSELTGVTRMGARHAGHALRWQGPGAKHQWRLEEPVEADALALASGVRPWALLERDPAIAVSRRGRGLVATLAFHPSAARDSDGSATALLRHLLVTGASAPVAWLQFEGVVVLRMDDPGSSEAAYHRSWAHPRLRPSEWRLAGDELARRRGRMAIGYVPGWVDDGDQSRGYLEIQGRAEERIGGKVHSSRAVVYRDRAGVSPGRVHDLAAQATAIDALRRRGVVELELHGFTHVHPDRKRWSRSLDRAEQLNWYRELNHVGPGADPLRVALKYFERDWSLHPTTVIPPGDAWGEHTLRRALDLGFELFDSYYLAIRHGSQWWWSQHVCSPYLDLAGESWFRAGLPVVGYFHERDIAIEGVHWFTDQLNAWERAGTRRFIDFRELAVALACRPSVRLIGGAPVVDLGLPAEVKPVRPVTVNVYLPGAERPLEIESRWESLAA